jgi:hydroxymethylbilane synthase
VIKEQMKKIIRIGTRESQLAVWQANEVKDLLLQHSYEAELVYIKSEGDLDLATPLYEMGVQGIFTRSLDAALLNNRIDIAVHSMKDVPTQLPHGVAQAAVLKRGPVHDLLVYKNTIDQLEKKDYEANIATSSLRRKAQWLNRYPHHQVHNLRGNVNTRLRKLEEENWDGAIFAEAGLERIGLRPANSIIIEWMMPAPAQGAIMVVCRSEDDYTLMACKPINDDVTALCTKIESDFLRELFGGCSTPISALAVVKDQHIHFRGNILSLDGRQKIEVEKKLPIPDAADCGKLAAQEVFAKGGKKITEEIRHATR